MENKTTKRRRNKVKKIKNLLLSENKDYCACGPMYKLKCSGACREAHTDKNGKVNCTEFYQINSSELLNNLKQLQKNRKKFINTDNTKIKREKRLKNNRKGS